MSQWDKKDKSLASINARAMNILYYALNAKVFNRISTCENSKDIGTLLRSHIRASLK